MSELPSFDHMRALCDQDPDAFELLREQIVVDYIFSVPDDRRNRLQGLQFQIDSKRKLATTPMAACIELSKMMHDTFWEMCCSLDEFADAAKTPHILRPVTKIKEQPTAEIIPLNRLN